MYEDLKSYYAAYRCPDGWFVKQFKDCVNKVGIDPGIVIAKKVWTKCIMRE